jgi:polyphenol oxidase
MSNPSRPAGHAPNRRDLLRGSGLALGALAVGGVGAVADHASAPHAEAPAKPFDFRNEKPRRRKSFHDLSDEEVRTLCLAVGYMRNGSGEKPLPLTSPLQWDQFALLHAHHCTTEDAGQVHWSWFFLPWHRAYLFFLERNLAHILTNVLKQDGDRFALPYWDWESHRQIPNTSERIRQGKPSPFFGYDLSLDSLSNVLPFDNLALWDGYRGPTPLKPDMKPENEETGPIWKQHTHLTRMYTDPAFLRSLLQFPWEVFGGSAITSRDDGQGMLEQFPHNLIHDWVGSRHGSNRDMGTLRYAALDPLFHLHHANVDRLWSLYPYTPKPGVFPAWDNKAFVFHDFDGKPVSVTVADILKEMALVTYDPPKNPMPDARNLVPDRPDMQKGPPKPDAAPLLAAVRKLEASPLTVKVEPKPELKPLLIRGDAKEHPAPSLLEIEIGSVQYTGRLSVRLFVNKENATIDTPVTDEHFVGLLSALDSHGGHHGGEDKASHRFHVNVSKDVSNFYKVVRPGEAFTLTLVPVGGAAALKHFGLTIKSVTLKVYE